MKKELIKVRCNFSPYTESSEEAGVWTDDYEVGKKGVLSISCTNDEKSVTIDYADKEITNHNVFELEYRKPKGAVK